MTRAVLICAALVVVRASAASAGGINLAWNDCLGMGGAVNRSFACDTNSGANDLYISFEPPVDIPDIRGANAIIDLQSAAATLPPWWQFKNPGSCRISSLQAVGVGNPHGTCPDGWQGLGIAGIAAYNVTATVPETPFNRARMLCSTVVPATVALPVFAGTEYFCLEVRIQNTGTVGTACAGCQEPACLVLNEVLVGSDNSGDFHITNPRVSNFATWQGGAIGGAGCPAAAPARNRTWGQLKGIYR